MSKAATQAPGRAALRPLRFQWMSIQWFGLSEAQALRSVAREALFRRALCVRNSTPEWKRGTPEPGIYRTGFCRRATPVSRSIRLRKKAPLESPAARSLPLGSHARRGNDRRAGPMLRLAYRHHASERPDSLDIRR